MIDFTLTEEEQMFLDAASRFGAALREQEREHEDSGYPAELCAQYEELGFADLEELPLGTRMSIWAKLAEADPSAPLGLGRWPGLERPGLGAIVVEEGLSISDGRVTGELAWLPRRRLDWLAIVGQRVWIVEDPRWEAVTRPCGLRACGGISVSLDDPVQAIEATDIERILRVFAAALMLGAARDAYGAAVEYAQERVAFGRPIAHHQGLAFKLADCATELDAAELLVGSVCGHANEALLANAVVYAHSAAASAADCAVQVLGGHGYLTDHRVEKRMRDIRAIGALFGGSLAAETDAVDGLLNLPSALELAP